MSKRETAKSYVERAFEIAGSGSVASVSEISAQLFLEGYLYTTIRSPSLQKQLRDRMIAKKLRLPVAAE